MTNLAKITLALATLLAGTARADLPFDQFIAFGASYDDSGQFPDLELGGHTGLRFTNIDPATGLRGLSMPEWLALDLGIGRMNPSTPLLLGPRIDTVDTDNINFAVGGYRSEQVLQSIVGDSVLPIGNVSAPGFLARVASGDVHFGPNTLFYALIAGNDIRDVDDPQQTAEISAQAVAALVNAGARYIVLPTLPRLGDFAELSNLTPTGRSQLAQDRNNAALAYNAAFAAELKAMPGNFIRIDTATFFSEVLADPTAYGFSGAFDQSRSCYSTHEAGGTQCNEPAGLGKSGGGNPDDFIFNDGLHPTQAAARGTASLMESVIRAPGLVALVPEAVLDDARGYLNTVSNHLTRSRWSKAPDPYGLFVAVQGRATDIDASGATVDASSDLVDLTIGGDAAIGNGFFVGAALGSQHGDTDLQGSSQFDTSGLSASLFAGYRRDIWFADLVLSASRTDVDNIDREFNLGTLVRQESGDTEADTWGASADVGVNMMDAGSVWRFGPFLALDYLDIDVDGYAEDGLRSTTMRFGDMSRKSELGSAGVFASYPMQWGETDVEWYGDIAYQYEFENSTEDVQAVVKTLSDGPWFRMPGYQSEDDQGVRASFGVDLGCVDGFRAGLSYTWRDVDHETQYLTLAASYAL